MHILSNSFLFPCLLPVGLKDEALGIGCDLLEPEISLVEGAGPVGNRAGTPIFPLCAAGKSLCKQIDNTISTFGVGPVILTIHFNTR